MFCWHKWSKWESYLRNGKVGKMEENHVVLIENESNANTLSRILVAESYGVTIKKCTFVKMNASDTWADGYEISFTQGRLD
jgi:hypothetical protein